MYEFYRQSVIGRALVDTIDDKVKTGQLTPKQAKFILEKFDESIPEVFTRFVTGNMSFKGKISSYNHVEGVWKFVANNFCMYVNNEYFKIDTLKIVACDIDTNAEVSRRRKKKN
ncbi:transcription initiation factor gamma subunit [Vairimorpha apis BRL 01]|uniref:Transcription initiation factor IIA subunit 2 n=1 Tax=Vairimorpha apis BRL 01 TaxID=1037528 RepID=T0KXB1_9MICR|nr:transcription initiation factor gamma subunit [Vairimorpha apis BRL 01]EQB60007.1 transcription initiation factor gamma subunit [Vairimorpha apis BRL 01]